MRTLKLELKDTKMEGTTWAFKVNNNDIGNHIAQLLQEGEFIGDITISIKQTGYALDRELEKEDEETTF
jgi:hypothetical protein